MCFCEICGMHTCVLPVSCEAAPRGPMRQCMHVCPVEAMRVSHVCRPSRAWMRPGASAALSTASPPSNSWRPGCADYAFQVLLNGFGCTHLHMGEGGGGKVGHARQCTQPTMTHGKQF